MAAILNHGPVLLVDGPKCNIGDIISIDSRTKSPGDGFDQSPEAQQQMLDETRSAVQATRICRRCNRDSATSLNASPKECQ